MLDSPVSDVRGQPPLPGPGEEGQSDRCELTQAHPASGCLLIAGSGLTDPVEEATGASLEGEISPVAPGAGTQPETERRTTQPKQKRELVPRPGMFKRVNPARQTQFILKLQAMLFSFSLPLTLPRGTTPMKGLPGILSFLKIFFLILKFYLFL